MERVSIIQNRSPVIIVVPHGADDNNTDVLAESAANLGGFNAVINRGFERSDEVDVLNDQANCNSVSHLCEDVVFDEFLVPLTRIKERALGAIYRKAAIKHGPFAYSVDLSDRIHIFIIHGAGNIVHKQANDLVGVILGIGEGKKSNSLSTDTWRRDAFADLWDARQIGKAYAARPGGKYAGRGHDNLNQYWRVHDPDKMVSSIQCEIPYSARLTAGDAEDTGRHLAKVIEEYLVFSGTHKAYSPSVSLPVI